MMNEKFPSAETLKSKILIDKLFTEGKSLKKYPVKLIYISIENLEIDSHKTGVSVPKRSFKKAVDRNFLKRLLREAFRKNKYLVHNNLPGNYALMFIYTAREKQDYHKIFSSITWLLKNLIEKEGANEKQDY